jgi:exonuclease SbcC
MRPLELELTAFRSYDRATVDLRPHELVVIGGDTGAGKTSLLDAVCFALFGRTPEQTRGRDLLTLGHRHGEVRLTFAARDEVWRAARRYGPDAPEPALVVERLGGDGGPAVETLGGEAASARLAAAVGMSYDAFTSAVLLAQGRFAEFLAAQPRDRDAILRELFGVASLEGARQAAREASSVATREAELRESDAGRLPRHAPGERAAAARAAREAAAALAAAERLRPVAARIAAAEAEEERARARGRRAGDAADELPDDRSAAELAERVAVAAEAAEAAEAAWRQAAGRRAARVAARDAARARHGGGAAELAALRERAEGAERLATLLPERREGLSTRGRALAERRRRLEALVATLAEAVAEHGRRGERAAAVAEWRRRRAEAEAALAAREADDEALAEAGAAHARTAREARRAERAQERWRRRDMAAALRAGLAAGDACPVCGGTVADHPVPHEAPADEAPSAEEPRAREREAARAQAVAAERARAAAGRAERAAAEEAAARADLAALGIAPEDVDEEAEATAARAREAAIAAAEAGAREERDGIRDEEARVALAGERLAADAAEVEAARASLGPWAAADAPARALAAAIEELHAAEAEADAAAAAAAETGEAAAAARGRAAALEAGPVAALRAAAARVAAQGGLEAPPDGLPAADLVAAAGRLRRAALDAAAAHESRAEEAAREARAEAERLAAAGGSCGVAGPADLDGVLRRAAAARDAARGRLGELEQAAAEARRLGRAAAAARAEAQAHAQVAADLRANGFPRFLLARYRERLAVGASARLQELTGGDFRFACAEPDPMAVVDLRRGERLRPASTLSGGERFLASLALALGLGEVAAQSGGRLDCLFLDEGFSTLDAESLEQALAGVERLSGDGRLVAVISHLPGVAERLGASIRVTKDPSGVSRIDGAPAHEDPAPAERPRVAVGAPG